MSDEQPEIVRRAKTIKPFPGVPDGQVMPKEFAQGDEVTGDLAAVAVREGWAEPIEGFDPIEDKPPAPKALAEMTKAELVDLAKEELGLDLDKDEKKDALIAAIEDARVKKNAP